MTDFFAGMTPTAAQLQALADTQLWARKGSDQGVTSSTTLVDCTDLSIAVDANATYLFDVYIFYTAPTDNVPDIKIQFVNPAGCTHTQIAFGLATTITGSAPYAQVQLIALGLTAGVIAAGSTGTVQALHVKGHIQVGATAGTSKIQFAQNTSSVNTTTVKAQSFMHYRRVA